MEDNKNTFEKNLADLENLVKGLESGDLPLNDAIDQYSKAIKIASDCSMELKNATEQVNKILNENGELVDFNLSE